eukprot:TRINITY_DN10936_c0_g1_i4.p1 TRINITY_DN10936_c0_g1~~TRINITY_DN10936_c0_g1_i4.p1  ORF type:complete len:739 (+),score=222.22 TRINITY_DN10936_c0_g1_i4:115-2217(+)
MDDEPDQASVKKTSAKPPPPKVKPPAPSAGPTPSASTSSTSLVSPSDYNPDKTPYHPINDACWQPGEPVPYQALAVTFRLVEATTKRLKIIAIVANFLRSVMVLTPEDLVPCVYLCTNDLAPAYAGIELGIGDMILQKAIAQATGRTLNDIRAISSKEGDLGRAAVKSKGKQARLGFARAIKPLTVSQVFKSLKEIALLSGNKSQQAKQDVIKKLLLRATNEEETLYLIRSLGGKMRIGLADSGVHSALGYAVTYTPPCQEFPPAVLDASRRRSPEKFKQQADANTLTIKTVFCECPNYDKILPILLKEGLEAMSEQCGITPGVPMKPMLAHPTKGLSEVMERFDGKTFACEYKYDGERAQVHMAAEGTVSIFSRNSEDNTTKYPDIVSRMKTAITDQVKDFVIDCEAVAYDPQTKQILPFQVLSTRKRKDADASDIEVQVCLFGFDLLFLNGKSYVKEPFSVRRDTLRKHFKHTEGEFHFADSLITSDLDEINEYLEQSIKDSCEGLMVKTLEVDATYEIAKRSHSWLKLKKDYLDGVGDTLDLVVLGGWIGKGKRTGMYGAFLLACYDEETEEYQAICKIGTGFTEDDLKTHVGFFKQHRIASPPSYYRYDSSTKPDEWFEPVQVWEVKAADLSISPRHQAAVGLVDPNKGISLRFPRYLRIRDDKKPEDATSAQQVASMYKSQEQIKNTNQQQRGPK